MNTTPLIRGLKVVGTFYRTKEEKAKLMTLVGLDAPVAIAFKAEPENPHDPHAVAIYTRVPPVESGEWVHCGYIPANVSALFARLLAEGDVVPHLVATADVTLEKNAPVVTISVGLSEGAPS
jgi:hypothetical protein